MDNIILMTDSYKVSHWKQYPHGTTHVYSYLEARKNSEYNEVVFFGLQYYLYRYLSDMRVMDAHIDEAEELFSKHFGPNKFFNRVGWEYIVNNWEGKLPIVIHALPEGSVVKPGTVMMTIENTDPRCFWLTSYIETLLMQIWYPSTIATKSRVMKKVIQEYLDKTGEDAPDFKLHDFGYRGSTSQESAAIGDAAHLVNFKGTDTLAGIRLLQKYYDADMPAFSIPAAEHSTITSWGEDLERQAYENMLDQFPEGLVAVVSDSYDVFNACSEIWGKQLKDKVQNRNGILVIRPDSGDPVIVLPAVLNLLGQKFGVGTNSKGYKVLPKYIRVIQGDGITEESLYRILDVLEQYGWSADNLAFGSGGGLLQSVTRDTCSFAIKCSEIRTFDSGPRSVSKTPVTDASKNSKAGRFTNPELIRVFENGDVLVDYTLDDIRERAKI